MEGTGILPSDVSSGRWPSRGLQEGMIVAGPAFFPPYQHSLNLLEGMGHTYS